MQFRSYPKIYNLGHADIVKLFDGPVFVQEKYDGSQLSWYWNASGQLWVKSKGKLQYGPEATPDKMFNKGVDYLLSLEPHPAYFFRGEYFSKPKHNTLEYDRMPTHGLVLYDAEVYGSESLFVSDVTLYDYARSMDITHAKGFDIGEDPTLADLKALLRRESSLGGPLVEGVVIKNYTRFNRDGKVMMGKLVSEEFKERHTRSWKKENPGPNEVIDSIINSLNTEARYRKAVQTLRDNGQILDTLNDIGPLMKQVKQDTLAEEASWISEQLYAYYASKISRGVGRGLPEWYKNLLAERQVY